VRLIGAPVGDIAPVRAAIAVPGPTPSALSAGCHLLVRDEPAVLVLPGEQPADFFPQHRRSLTAAPAGTGSVRRVSDAAVVLMAYGSPERIDDVPAYYADIRGGRPIAPEHTAEILNRCALQRSERHHHQLVGGFGFKIAELLCERRASGLIEYAGARPIPSELNRYRGWAGKQTENRFSHWIWRQYASAFWDDVRLDRVLPFREARDQEDEKHIHPLQLDVIDRCLVLWSNPGERVLTPFMGVGSEVYAAVRAGRFGLGVELKPSYYRQAVRNLASLVDDHAQEGLLLLLEPALIHT